MRPNNSGGRWIIVAACSLAFLTFSLTVVRYLNSPLRFDEVEWPIQAEGIIRHGVPKVLYSDDRTLYTHSYYGYDAHYGMWHPPLYLYSLAAAAVFFGTGNVPMRSVGLIWFALSLCVLWRILALLPNRPNTVMLRAIPFALALLTPLIAEGSLYLDIDNTSLAFGLLLFAFLFLKSPNDDSPKQLLFLTLSFAFSLWSKLTTPFVMLASLVAYHWLNGNYRRGALQGLVIGGIGSGIFLLTYLLYCKVLGYPPWFMFEITYLGKKGLYASPHALKEILHSLRWHFVWISPPIAIMLLVLTVNRARAYFVRRQLEKVDFLLIFSLAGLAVYTLWGALWGKYSFPAVLSGVIALGHQISSSRYPERIAHTRTFLILVLGLLVVHLIGVPPLQLRPPGFDLRSAGLRQAVADSRNVHLLVSVGAFAAFLIVTRYVVLAEKRETGLLLTLLLIYVLTANPINAMKILLSADDRSPYRPFRDRGFTQTVELLNTTLRRDDVILSPKDVGFYFRGKHYSTEQTLAFHGVFGLRRLALSSEVDYVVDSEKYPTIPERDLLVGTPSIVPLKRIGDFVIYRTHAKSSG